MWKTSVNDVFCSRFGSERPSNCPFSPFKFRFPVTSSVALPLAGSLESVFVCHWVCSARLGHFAALSTLRDSTPSLFFFFFFLPSANLSHLGKQRHDGGGAHEEHAFLRVCVRRSESLGHLQPQTSLAVFLAQEKPPPPFSLIKRVSSSPPFHCLHSISARLPPAGPGPVIPIGGTPLSVLFLVTSWMHYRRVGSKSERRAETRRCVQRRPERSCG